MATSSEDALRGLDDDYSTPDGVAQTSVHSGDSFEPLSPSPSVCSLRSQDFLELEQSRSRKRSLEEVLEEDDDEDFDLESWLSSSASTDVPDSVMHFLKIAFSKCLSHNKRKMLINACPRPNVPLLRSPVADKDITNILGRDFPTDQDKQLVKIQSSVLSAAGPAIGLLIDLAKQDFSGDTDELIPVRDVMEVLKETLVLVGNASCFISETRRLGIVNKIKPKRPRLASFLQEICSEDMGEPSGELFGPIAKKRITERAQTIKDFNESLRSLDSASKGKSSFKSRFLGRGSGAKYGEPSSLPQKQPYTKPTKVFRHYQKQTNPQPSRFHQSRRSN